MSTLSGTFPKSAPGLPRGKASLDPADANAQQRARLLRAVISAVADKGYQATTVADVVQRARVSRSVMYREFDGKLDCFLAGIEAGRELMAENIAEAIAEASDGSLDRVAAAVSRAYLETCVRETEHARAWVLELAAAGPEGIQAHDRYLDGFVALTREIDCRYGSGNPRPDEHYVALVGGIAELVGREIRADASAALPGLEDAITAILVAMLR